MKFGPTALLAAAVVSLSLIVGASPAYAEAPAPPPTSKSAVAKIVDGDVWSGYADVTAGQLDFVKMAVKATDKKYTDKKGRIDYRRVKKAFKGHPSLRDGFAAGWYSRRNDWKQFTHMSKADKKAVVKWSKTRPGPNPKLRLALKPKPCTGVTKWVKPAGDPTGYQWLNSCDTKKAQGFSALCAPAVGVLGSIAAAATGGSLAIPVAVGVFGCVGNLAWLAYAADRSDLNATIVELTISAQKLPNGKSRFTYWIYPQ